MTLHLSLLMDGEKTEGIGAMMMYPIMLGFICKFFNVGFSFSGIKDLAHFEYSDYAKNSHDWSKMFEDFFDFPKIENPDKIIEGVGFDQNLINYIELNRNIKEEILINLYQHGPSWNIQQFFNQNCELIATKERIDYFKNNLKYDGETYFKDGEINVVLHIRAQNPVDVNIDENGFCILPSDILRELYNREKDFPRHLNLIDRLKKKYYNKKIVIHICSQGFVNSFENYLELSTDFCEIKLHIDKNPIEDLYHMIYSDVFVMANSGFSYIASLMRSGVTYTRDNFWCTTLSSAIKVDYDFNIPLEI